MLRYLSFVFFFAMTSAGFGQNIFPVIPNFKQFNTTDLEAINHFCVTYKNNLIKSFELIDSSNVSKDTFNIFVLLTTNRLRLANIDFFHSLKELGANQCDFFLESDNE